ncbi:hypothetical protein LguiA_029905 [Lonicera macranthoides]
MDMEYSGWFVKYRVDLDALMNAFPESISRYLVRREDNEDSFLPFFFVHFFPSHTAPFNLTLIVNDGVLWPQNEFFWPGEGYCETKTEWIDQDGTDQNSLVQSGIQ